ncbi:MAG: patatin-like phospholipase family protein [Gammaproteobacteria bacterium]
MAKNLSETGFVQVLHDELDVIKSQRQNRGDTRNGSESAQLTGLAISGGGIRSASFALGVLQGLNKHDLLRKVDYLSTVSGGGYIGSSLTWFNFLNKQAGSPWMFPFGLEKDRRRGESGNVPLNFLRQNGNYLLPDDLSSLSLLGIVLRNMTVSASVYLAVIVSIFYFSMPFFQPMRWILPFVGNWQAASLFAQAALVMVLLFGMTSFIYAWMTWLTLGTEERGYRGRFWFQRVQGNILFLALASGLLALLPYIDVFIKTELGGMDYMSTSVPAMLGVIGSIYEFFQQQKGKNADKGTFADMRILLTSLLLIIGILAIAYQIALDWKYSNTPWLYGVTIIGVVLTGWFVNLNLYGIGRMDRDRLMEAFMPNPEAVSDNRWGLATRADVTFFSKVSGADQWGPYHIVNTNVVLVDSKHGKYRGRGGDNFIISNRYCGSDATGFYPIDALSRGEMTLATAISISGAALNPNAANSGQGTTRNRLVSFLLAFLNIRLGFWIQNPAVTGWRKVVSDLNTRPNFFYPGFFQGLLGKDLREEVGYLELTDGGHFDNTGLYELIRRRVDTIYFSSAGADPNFTLDDIGSILVRIQVDFGVTITFHGEMESLMPGSEDDSSYAKRFGFSRMGFDKGIIHYPAGGTEPEKKGTLYLVRATVVKDLPAQIYSYRAQHEEFPNQSTNDQFFDESQIEAYRELGFRLTNQMCTALSIP